MTPEIEKRIKAVQAGRVPAGYKKSKVGVVPKEWEELKLSHYLSVSKEKNKDLQYSKDDVFSISGELGIVNQIELLGRSYAGESVAPYGIVKPNDIVYTKSPLKANPYGIIKTNKTGKTGIVSTLYAIFNCKNNVNPNFVQYYFESDKNLNDYLHPIVNIGAKHDMKISDENSLSGIVVFPPIGEQKKIAEILATQDRVIELKEKLIAEKQSLKKYLMSVLLGDDFKKPFKLNGVTIDKKKWEKKKLGDICDTFSGGTPSRSHPEYFNGDIPWIKSGELNQENIYETEEFLTKKGIESSSAKMVKKGTLLIAMYGATAGVLAVSHIDAAINQAILALIPNIDINSFYLKNAIANQIDVAVHRLVQGGQPNFNASIINAFELRLPTLPEQKAIAEVLSAADEEISLLQKDLEQEKLKKKSLMQLLLTGLVRVNE